MDAFLSYPGHTKKQLNNSVFKTQPGTAAHSSFPPCFLPRLIPSHPPVYMMVPGITTPLLCPNFSASNPQNTSCLN